MRQAGDSVTRTGNFRRVLRNIELGTTTALVPEPRGFVTSRFVAGRLLQSINEVAAVQPTKGVRLSKFIGGTVDALKLVSSLTLFRRAAHRLAEPSADPAFANLDALATKVLAVAVTQGFDPCVFTDPKSPVS